VDESPKKEDFSSPKVSEKVVKAKSSDRYKITSQELDNINVIIKDEATYNSFDR